MVEFLKHRCSNSRILNLPIRLCLRESKREPIYPWCFYMGLPQQGELQPLGLLLA